MKKVKNALLLALCAVLLVGATIAGTVAYLTSQTEVVKNTFSVGSVKILLDETDTDNSKTHTDKASAAGRDLANAYHLMPGGTYPKDPIVHVLANSEDSWVFVKVENGLADYEADTTIEQQIKDNGWTELPGVDNVYYMSYTKTATDKQLPVFANFTIAEANAQGEDWTDVADKTIEITAYAIQKANGSGEFAVADAWKALGN